MCLAIPMQIQSISGLTAHCVAKGAERDVSLLMLPEDDPVQVGDFIQVSLGAAVAKVSAEDAKLAWELFDQILNELGGPACGLPGESS